MALIDQYRKNLGKTPGGTPASGGLVDTYRQRISTSVSAPVLQKQTTVVTAPTPANKGFFAKAGERISKDFLQTKKNIQETSFQKTAQRVKEDVTQAKESVKKNIESLKLENLSVKRLWESAKSGAKQLPSQIKMGGGAIAGGLLEQDKLLSRPFSEKVPFITPKGITIHKLLFPSIAQMEEENRKQQEEYFKGVRETGAEESKKLRGEYQGKFEPTEGLQKYLELVTFNAPQVVASTGLTLGTALITKNPALTTSVGIATSYGLGASEVYQDAKEFGVADNVAVKLASLGGIIIGALDFLPLERLIRKTGVAEPIKKSIIQKISGGLVSSFSQGGFEAVTEGAQEVIGNAIARTYDENRDLLQGVPEASFVGAILGGVSNVGVELLNLGNPTIGENIETSIQDALETPKKERTEEQQKIVDTLLNQTFTPDEVMTYVSENEANTELGKMLVRYVAEAKSTDQNIQVSVSEDNKTVSVSLVSPGAKVEIPTSEVATPKVAERIESKIFNTDTTGMDSYDQFLEDKPFEGVGGYKTVKEYLEKQKGKVGEIVEMTPDEYLSKIGKKVAEKARLESIRKVVESGQKLDMPVLDYTKKIGESPTQEGMHRATLAKEMGEEKIPVLVIREAVKAKEKTKVTTPKKEVTKKKKQIGTAKRKTEVAVAPETAENVIAQAEKPKPKVKITEEMVGKKAKLPPVVETGVASIGKSVISDDPIRGLTEEEIKSAELIDKVKLGQSVAERIAKIPGFLSPDKKIRDLIFTRGDDRWGAVHIAMNRGSVPSENIAIVSNNWEMAYLRSDDPTRVVLLQRTGHGGDFMGIVAERQNGFFVITTFETRRVKENQLGNILKNNKVFNHAGKRRKRLPTRIFPKGLKTTKVVREPVITHSMEMSLKSDRRYQKKSREISRDRDGVISKREALGIIRQYFTPEELKVDFIPRILDNHNAEAFGYYTNGLIRFIEHPHKSTPFHEAVHAYLDLFTTQNQKDEMVRQYINSQITEGRTLSYQQAEEEIAQDFIRYVKNKQLQTPFKKLYDKIIQFLKSLVGKENKVDRLYEDIISRRRNKVEREMPSYQRYFQENEEMFKRTTKTIDFIERNIKKETLTKDQVRQYLSRQGITKVDKELFEDALNEMPNTLNVRALIQKVRSKMMPLYLIRSSSYNNYGSQHLKTNYFSNKGKFSPVDLDDFETHIWDTPFLHGYHGHFGGDFPKRWTDYEIKPIKGTLEDGTSVDMYAVVQKGVPLTTENVEEVTVNVSDTKNEAEEWVAKHQNTLERDSGLLGHTRRGVKTSNVSQLKRNKNELSHNIEELEKLTRDRAYYNEIRRKVLDKDNFEKIQQFTKKFIDAEIKRRKADNLTYRYYSGSYMDTLLRMKMEKQGVLYEEIPQAIAREFTKSGINLVPDKRFFEAPDKYAGSEHLIYEDMAGHFIIGRKGFLKVGRTKRNIKANNYLSDTISSLKNQIAENKKEIKKLEKSVKENPETPEIYLLELQSDPIQDDHVVSSLQKVKNNITSLDRIESILRKMSESKTKEIDIKATEGDPITEREYKRMKSYMNDIFITHKGEKKNLVSFIEFYDIGSVSDESAYRFRIAEDISADNLLKLMKVPAQREALMKEAEKLNKAPMTTVEKQFFQVGEKFHERGLQEDIRLSAWDYITEKTPVAKYKIPTELTLGIMEWGNSAFPTSRYSITANGFERVSDSARNLKSVLEYGEDRLIIPEEVMIGELGEDWKNKINEYDTVLVDEKIYEVNRIGEDNSLILDTPSNENGTIPYQHEGEGYPEEGDIIVVGGVNYKVIKEDGNTLEALPVEDVNDISVSDAVDDIVDGDLSEVIYEFKAIAKEFGTNKGDDNYVIMTPEKAKEIVDYINTPLEKRPKDLFGKPKSETQYFDYPETEHILELISQKEEGDDNNGEGWSADDFDNEVVENLSESAWDLVNSGDYFDGMYETVRFYNDGQNAYLSEKEPEIFYTPDEYLPEPIFTISDRNTINRIINKENVDEITLEEEKKLEKSKAPLVDADGKYIFNIDEEFAGEERENMRTVMKYYRDKVIPYFRKTRKDAKLVTDPNGFQWWETTISENDKDPIVSYQTKRQVEIENEIDKSVKYRVKDIDPARSPEDYKNRIDQLNKVAQSNAILRRTRIMRDASGRFEHPKPPKVPKGGQIALHGEVIQSDFQYMTVLAHELGHALEYKLTGATNKNTIKVFGDKLDSKIENKIWDELKAVTNNLEGEGLVASNPSYYNRKTELLARFFQKMFESPDNLIELAPTAVKYLEYQSITHPEIQEYLEATQEAIDKGSTKFKFLPDLRQTYQKHLGFRVGNIAFDEEMNYRAMKERAKIVMTDFVKNKFKGIKDDPALLFRTAEAIQVTRAGEPVFGTRDYVVAKNAEEVTDLEKTGWELVSYEVKDNEVKPKYARTRYTPEQGQELFDALSPEGKKLILDFTVEKEDAKDYFNREIIKDVAKIDSNIEGWVHHLFISEGKSNVVGKNLKFKEKVAGTRKQRKGAEGYVEDFQKAMTKALVELEVEKAYNEFIVPQFARVTKAIPEGGKPDAGWVEVVGNVQKGIGTPREKRMVIMQDGKTFIAKQPRYQMPIPIYERYKLWKGFVDEASIAVRVVNDINRYWRINILSHVGTAGTNMISGAIQFSSKVLTDFYTETLTGNVKYEQTRADVKSMLEVLTPRGWRNAPDWVYGADLSNWYGEFSTQKAQGVLTNTRLAEKVKVVNLDSYANATLKLFGTYERYWKKVISLSEGARTLKGLSEVSMSGLRLPTVEEKAILAQIGKEVDLYAYDYDNVPLWLEAHQRSVVGQAIKPFAKYPYKYAKMISNFIGSVFDANLPWQERVSKLLALATIMGLYAWYADDREKRQQTPAGTAETPARISPRGRLLVGTDAEGKELFVRTAKYPFLNLTDASRQLLNKNWEAGVDIFADMIGTISPVGEIGLLGLGYRNKYEMFDPPQVVVGNALASYMPLGRVLDDASRMLDPFQRKQTNFYQTLTKYIPTTSEALQEKLHGEKRTVKIPLEGSITREYGEKKTRTTTDRVLYNYWQDILLSALTGIYLRRIDPEEAKAFSIREEENRIKREKEAEKEANK